MLNSNGHQMLQKKADSTDEPCVFRWDTVHTEPSSLLGNSHPCAQMLLVPQPQPWSALPKFLHRLNPVGQIPARFNIMWTSWARQYFGSQVSLKISSLIIFSEAVWVLVFQQMLINALMFTLPLIEPIFKMGLHAKLKTGNMNENKITV